MRSKTLSNFGFHPARIHLTAARNRRAAASGPIARRQLARAIGIISPMPKRPRVMPSLPLDDTLFAVKMRKGVPHQFVLDAISALSPMTRPMFGCLAVYVADKIVLILRDKRGETADNGVWLATSKEHHESLRGEFPNMRSIQVLGKGVTGWQVLSVDTPDFEEAALHACELILARDARIGKVPGTRRASGSRATKSPKPKRPAKRRARV